MDFIKTLNDRQLEAVRHVQGPLLVLAGAGSGKTRVITGRIAYLIQRGLAEPEGVLAVTFTNKAAQEMKSRVRELVGRENGPTWVCTFHAACVRILRRDAEHAGLRTDFTILDTADQMGVVRECMKRLKINESLHAPKEVARRISALKNRLTAADSYAAASRPFGIEDKVAKTYLLYEERLRSMNAMDFDDLLLWVIRLFERRPERLDHYRRKFRFLLVDEYQDTNPAQYRLIRLLGEQGNVCVVGDDDQSIYAFRGADIGNILRFERDFPAARVIRLEQNYRSSQTILDAAGAVVSRIRRRTDKRLWTRNQQGGPVCLSRVEDEEGEARFVCQSIREAMAGDGASLGDFAVLYRTHAQSRALEEAFRAEAIPYRIVGGLRFYERREIKDLLAYLRAVERPEDDHSLRRIINVPTRGIGEASLERLEAHARCRGIGLGEALCQVDRIQGLTTAQARALSELKDLLDGLRRTRREAGLSELLTAILQKTGYERMLQEEQTSGGAAATEARTRMENISELISSAKSFELRASDDGDGGAVSAFLDHVALVMDPDDPASARNGKPAVGAASVTLMTLHSAKGLEFPFVYMTGMEEGLFPHQSSLADEQELEEERRLCYVGMTRARARLILSYAERRRQWGSTHWNPPSRFIEEIPPQLVRETVWGSRRASGGTRPSAPVDGPRETRRRADHSPAGSFQIGSRVRHPHWGVGRVQKAEGAGEDQKVLVLFGSVGIKKLAVKVARLEKIG